MCKVRRYGTSLVFREDLGLWEGDIAPILDEAEAVDLHWKGGKIPARILWECLTWFRKVNEKHSSEAQARLGYNPTTKEWCWVAFPQYVVAGLYSKEIPSDELTEEQRAMRLRATKEMADGGFMEAGTIHSHCDAGAFASGIDDKDESTQNGVHITLGKITSDQPEIHGRVVFRKIKYAIHWEDWLADAPADLPENFCFPAKEAPIDEERLMGLCFERPKTDSVAIKSNWPSGEWSLYGNAGTYGGRSNWDDRDWDHPSGYGDRTSRCERDPDYALEEFADSALDVLFSGDVFEGEAILAFITYFTQRLIELEVYSPHEILSAMVDGMLGGREATGRVR